MANDKKHEIIIQGTLSEANREERFRRSRLTEDLIQQICELLQISVFYETALAASNISLETMNDWMRTGREYDQMIENGQTFHSRITKHQKLCVSLYQQVRQAIAIAEVRDTQRLEFHINKGSETALRFKMERRYPKNWGNVRDNTAYETQIGQLDNAIDATPLVGSGSNETVKSGVIDYGELIQNAGELRDTDNHNGETHE